MQKIIDNINLLCGDLNLVCQTRPFEIFSDITLNFLDNVSREILESPNSNLYPDLITLAFFCRKKNLSKYKDKYLDSNERLGRGLVFHITPSNVALNFFYSLISALLSGCPSVVKISSKEFPQIDLLLTILNKILNNYKSYKSLFCLIRYDSSNFEISEFFSSICLIRAVWGGDDTVQNIRKIVLNPKAIELVFSNRISVSFINASSLTEENLGALVNNFYKDTYKFYQQACSSPKFIFWIGKKNTCEFAKGLFWSKLSELVSKDFNAPPISSMDKLVNVLRQCVATSINACFIDNEPNVTVVHSNEMLSVDSFYNSGDGYFVEYFSQNLEDCLLTLSRSVQSITYFGFDKVTLLRAIIENRIYGVDRIVPIGQAIDFELVWDGYDLIRHMSRKITYQ